MHLHTKDEQPHKHHPPQAHAGFPHLAHVDLLMNAVVGGWPSAKGPGSALTLHSSGAVASEFWPLTVRDAEPAGSHGSSDQRGS